MPSKDKIFRISFVGADGRLVWIKVVDRVPTEKNNMKTQEVAEFPGHLSDGDDDILIRRMQAIADHLKKKYGNRSGFAFLGAIPLKDGK